MLDLLIDGETGIWHLANRAELSWFEFARAIAEGAGLDASLIFDREVEPPRRTALVSARGQIMRPLQPALDAYLAEVRTAPPAMPAAPRVTPRRAAGSSLRPQPATA